MGHMFYLILIMILVYWLEMPVGNRHNVLITRKCPAEELEKWLKSFNWSHRQEFKENKQLPIYKFYTEVIEVLLDLARKLGGNYQESLLFLREGLQIDRQFEKKIKEATLGIWLQMLLMFGLTWVFIFSALKLVDVKVGVFSLFLILGWQLLGLMMLPFVMSYLRKKYFSDIGKLWRILFILRSLLKVPLSRSEIMTMAGVQELKSIKQKSLSALVQKLMEACQRALKLGISYEEDINYLMEELRFQEKWHFELYEKRLTVIKLALLSIFFLPSYLAFIFLLLGDLMALM